MNTQKTADFPTLDVPFRGTQGSFFPARLMDPLEVKTAIENRPPEVGSWTNGKWCLCGDVRSELFAMFKAEFRDAIAVRLTAYTTPAGGHYAVVSHQLFGWAHRFVLPLYETKVQQMLIEMQKAELGFLFGNEGAQEAVLTRSPLSRTAFAPLLAMTNPLPKESVLNVIAELPRVISAMNLPKQVPSLRRGEKVEDVSVSVVLPTQAMAQFCSHKSKGPTQ
jgi:hypothetical protein